MMRPDEVRKRIQDDTARNLHEEVDRLFASGLKMTILRTVSPAFHDNCKRLVKRELHSELIWWRYNWRRV